MRKLEFTGMVQPDATPKLIIPGRDDLFLKPDDWPTKLAPAVKIEVGTFPDGLSEIGEGEGLARLDKGKFRPVLVIPQRKIGGSTLTPDTDHPTRGFAEVWRADLHVIGNGQETTCWVIWIIGSNATGVLRLVAEEDLRVVLKLADGMAVRVTIWEEESKWQPPTPDEIIADWCEAARGVEDDWGREKAMGYLIGEKFLNFLERAETDRDWRDQIDLRGLAPCRVLEHASPPGSIGPYCRRRRTSAAACGVDGGGTNSRGRQEYDAAGVGEGVAAAGLSSEACLASAATRRSLE